MSAIASYLQRLKAVENPEEDRRRGPLLSADVLKVLAAWPSIFAGWEDPGDPPDAEAALWSWLWSGVEIDDEEVAVVSGLPLSRAVAALEIAIMNRLVYPDGSLSDVARAATMATTKEVLRT